jgi:hypothetical protein
MIRPYYTLCEKIDGKWCPQFGDYSRANVMLERRDYRDHGIKAKNMTVICTPPGQPNIDAAIAALNK